VPFLLVESLNFIAMYGLASPPARLSRARVQRGHLSIPADVRVY